jgi:hypothetical protein
MLPSTDKWQVRVVVGAEGGAAVRFLAPHRHGLIEIPASVVAEAARQLGYEVAPTSAPEAP